MSHEEFEGAAVEVAWWVMLVAALAVAGALWGVSAWA